jgi:hypothetical protein
LALTSSGSASTRASNPSMASGGAVASGRGSSIATASTTAARTRALPPRVAAVSARSASPARALPSAPSPSAAWTLTSTECAPSAWRRSRGPSGSRPISAATRAPRARLGTSRPSWSAAAAAAPCPASAASAAAATSASASPTARTSAGATSTPAGPRAPSARTLSRRTARSASLVATASAAARPGAAAACCARTRTPFRRISTRGSPSARSSSSRPATAAAAVSSPGVSARSCSSGTAGGTSPAFAAASARGARQERRQHHLPARAGVGDVVLVRDRVHDLDRAHRLEVRQLADAVHGVEPHPRPGVVGRDLQQLETPQAGVRARPHDRARRHRLRRVEHADQLGVGLADQLREHRHDGVDHLRARPVERRRDLHQVGALREPEVPDRLGRRPRHVGLGVAQERRQIAAGVPQRRQPEGRVRPHDRAAVAEREDEVFHDELGLGFHQLGVAQRTRLEIELPHGAAPILRRGPAATGGRGPGF